MTVLLQGHFIIYEVFILFLIIMSGFFSGTETALVSANRLRLESLAANGLKSALRSIRILDQIEEAIGLVLMGNNFVNITATAFITYVASSAFHYNEYALLGVTIIQTIVFLIVCEVSPKIIATQKADRHLMRFSTVLLVMLFLLRPVIKFSLVFSDLLKKLFRFTNIAKPIMMSREEIDIIFRMGSKEGLIDEKERYYVSEILSFRDITAQEIATPTIDIISIEQSRGIRELVDLIVKTKFSRIPVYDERVDNIVGYVFYRDLLQKKQIKKVHDILKPAFYVPATKKISELYYEMQKQNMPLAFVVNEFGGVIGMVSHEDVAEEVVGEIQTRDHFDESLIVKVSDYKYLLDPNIDIEFFNRLFNVDIVKRGFETLAGFLEYRTGKIPGKGEKIQHGKFIFCIEEASPRSLEKVSLTLKKKNIRIK